MNIKIKKANNDGIVRLETSGNIKEISINETFSLAKETISVCFRGKNSSGIIELTPSEIENMYFSIKGKTNLVKGFKKFKIN